MNERLMQVRQVHDQPPTKMCFFEMTRFDCGDWKWGNFKVHCNREYRIGETCGMKLVHSTYDCKQKCSRCDRVDTKLRRRAKIAERITRWQAEGRCPASVEKGMEEIAIIDKELQALYDEIGRARTNIGNQKTPAYPQYYQ
jgi:hypothetical protein